MAFCDGPGKVSVGHLNREEAGETGAELSAAEIRDPLLLDFNNFTTELFINSDN